MVEVKRRRAFSFLYRIHELLPVHTPGNSTIISPRLIRNKSVDVKKLIGWVQSCLGDDPRSSQENKTLSHRTEDNSKVPQSATQPGLIQALTN